MSGVGTDNNTSNLPDITDPLQAAMLGIYDSLSAINGGGGQNAAEGLQGEEEEESEPRWRLSKLPSIPEQASVEDSIAIQVA